VNTATLGLVVEDIVFHYKGLGPGILLKMTYNSGSRSTGLFGQGWRFAYESEIRENKGIVEVWRGSGRCLRFNRLSRLILIPSIRSNLSTHRDLTIGCLTMTNTGYTLKKLAV